MEDDMEDDIDDLKELEQGVPEPTEILRRSSQN